MWGRGRRTFEQQRRWDLVRAELWKGRRSIAAAGVFLLGSAIALLLMPWGPWGLRGFIAGSLVTSYFWMIFVISMVRTYPATVGEWGESFTRELLGGRGFGWPTVDDVPLERRNVDHVAVSPSAILAIETKFIGAGRHWETDSYRESAMQGARSSARSVSLILRSRGIVGLPVQPVLMLWGPAAPKLQNGWAEMDGVHVVCGVDPEGWRQRCRRGAIDSGQATEVTRKLLEHREMRDAYRRRS